MYHYEKTNGKVQFSKMMTKKVIYDDMQNKNRMTVMQHQSTACSNQVMHGIALENSFLIATALSA